MKKLLSPLVGFAAGALILAGCSTGGSDSPTDGSSAQPSTAASDQPQDQVGGQRGAPGVSGEIVYAKDGTLQVQNTQSQTAVRYTEDTTVEQQVTIALSDVTVGSCVFAIVGEDGTATAITVSEPVDGECTAGFGQGGFPGGGDGEFPGGGDRPSDFPTALQDGGEFPSDAPTDFPSGGPDGGDFPSGGFGGTFVTGSVTAVSGSGLSVDTEDGPSDVTVGSATTITGTQPAEQSAIVVGLCLTAQGASDDSGGFDATSITLSTKGEDGCSSGFGGIGGFRGDRGQGGGSNG